MARVELKGNAGTDAELKFIKGKNGDFAVTTFSLAETERTQENGVWMDGETTWWRVSITGKNAESAVEIKKGDKVFAVGTLRKPTTYQGKDGSTQVGLELKAESFGVIPRVKQPQPKAQAETDSFWS
jgi:single stranded DNA-binding protein